MCFPSIMLLILGIMALIVGIYNTVVANFVGDGFLSIAIGTGMIVFAFILNSNYEMWC